MVADCSVNTLFIKAQFPALTGTGAVAGRKGYTKKGVIF
jgi:hypothetical protein